MRITAHLNFLAANASVWRLPTLEEALNELDLDREFLKAGGVFTDEAIDAYIALRREEDDRVRMTPHPVEFELYYSV